MIPYPVTPDPLAVAQARIAELETELRATRQELDAFSYSVSHDLRSPLRHIVGHIELFKSQVQVEDGSKAAKYLGTVSDAAKRLGLMLDGLLAYSRTGRVALQPQSVDMNALVAEVLVALADETAGRAIAWQIEPLPPAQGDAALLRALWEHLIGNAVKFTSKTDGATIAISAQALPDGRTEYAVRDNGAGFEMAHAGKLFGVFQRLHLPREFDGIGVGAALSRRIVERHGGTIGADSAAGAGSRFFFTLQPSASGTPCDRISGT